MPTQRYNVFEMQIGTIHDFAGLPMVATSGGKFIITAAGAPTKATLYDPDTFAALANPVTPTRGKIRFATLDTVTSVDLFGFAPGGNFVVRKGVKPGGVQEIITDPTRPHQCAVIPFSYADYTIAAEQDTGLDFPTGALILPTPFLRVTTLDATETMDWGLLSSESGGDADGLMLTVSVASAVSVPGALAGTDTLGALLKEDTNGSSVLVPKGYPVASAVSLSLLFSADSDSAAGYAYFPYINLVN